MEWSGLTPALLVCLILMIGPGLLVTLGARLRGFDAVALAAPISVGLIAVSAVLSPMAGIGWSTWVPFATGLLVAALFRLILWGWAASELRIFPSRRINDSSALSAKKRRAR